MSGRKCDQRYTDNITILYYISPFATIKISLSVANSGAPGASPALSPTSIVGAGTTGTAPYNARLPRIENVPVVANLTEVTTR